MAALVVTLFTVPSAQASSSGAAVGHAAVSGSAVDRFREPERAAPNPCVPRLRRAVVNRRAATWHWQSELRIFRTPTARKARTTTSCSYLGWIKRYWSLEADRHYRSWIATFTILDFPYGDGNGAWFSAVNQADRVYPGTRSWLLSCSRPEGGHGRWVVHGGSSYYAGAEDAKDGKEVGGNMQYTYGTFSGHFRHAAEDLIRRGYRLPAHLRRSSVTAWRSAAAQALAAAWARVTGNDNQHWIASWASGCR
jgi:hypothetical protein